MFLISHRGNIDGRDEARENSIDYVNEALSYGYYVEIDVWKTDTGIYLGHDTPQYEVETNFLRNPLLWCHAKNQDALFFMIKNGIHCFWHQNDEFTITNRGYIWQYPCENVYPDSIFLFPELFETEHLYKARGICSDYIKNYEYLKR